MTQTKRKIEEKEKLPPSPDYEPTAFLRCHSRDNDPNDDSSKVWKSAFEPSLQNTGETTYILATCGSKVVNFIDCQTGKVMKRYNDTDSNESFYTLAWSTLPIQGKTSKCNILAVAGEGCCIKLLYPTQLVMYSSLSYHKKYISALLFHPTIPNYLYSSARDGWIVLWDIGLPDLTWETKADTRPLLRLAVPNINSDAINLVYSPTLNILVAACENGCIGWKFDAKNLQKTQNKNRVLSEPDYIIVQSNEKQTIDGLIMLTQDLVASKEVGTGIIKVWNIKENISTKKTKFKQIQPILELEYTSTQVDYLNFGFSQGMLCVGDDEGQLYLYNLQKQLKNTKSVKHTFTPSQVLEWPELNIDSKSLIDDEAVPELENQKIVINCVSVSSDKEYIVYGTDTNLLCIWKKC